jgi:eukaryotic-like serine/threonine-protein kinase
LSNESEQSELYVQSFPQPGSKQQLTSKGASGRPRWSRDGKELYYIAPDATLMAIAVRSTADAFEASVPKPLFKAPVSTNGAAQEYEVAPDGRFLINADRSPAQPRPITLVLNWAGTLRETAVR